MYIITTAVIITSITTSIMTTDTTATANSVSAIAVNVGEIQRPEAQGQTNRYAQSTY